MEYILVLIRCQMSQIKITRRFLEGSGFGDIWKPFALIRSAALITPNKYYILGNISYHALVKNVSKIE